VARRAKTEETDQNETVATETKAEKATVKTDEAQPEQQPEQQPNQQQQQQQQIITVNDADVFAGYANFCRVSSTPEELILDLGLNPNPYAPGNITVNVAQRIIMNHYTAKRMLQALSVALQRHEQAFGVLETDVRRRVVAQ